VAKTCIEVNFFHLDSATEKGYYGLKDERLFTGNRMRFKNDAGREGVFSRLLSLN
jgi:hypothetical protein